MSRPSFAPRTTPGGAVLAMTLVSIGAAGGWLSRSLHDPEPPGTVQVRTAHRTPTATYSSSSPAIPPLPPEEQPSLDAPAPAVEDQARDATLDEAKIEQENAGEPLAEYWARLEAKYQALEQRRDEETETDLEGSSPSETPLDQDPDPALNTFAANADRETPEDGQADDRFGHEDYAQLHAEDAFQVADLDLGSETAGGAATSHPSRVLVQFSPVLMLPLNGTTGPTAFPVSTEAATGNFIGERSPLSGVTYFGTGGKQGPRNPWAPIDLKGRNNPWGPTTLTQ